MKRSSPIEAYMRTKQEGRLVTRPKSGHLSQNDIENLWFKRHTFQTSVILEVQPLAELKTSGLTNEQIRI